MNGSHPVPPFGLGERNAQYRDVLDKTLRAEARIDSLERRYLSALKVLYEVYPAVEKQGLDRLRASWRPPPLAPDASQDEQDRAAIASAIYAEEVKRLNGLAESIRGAVTAPDGPAPDLTTEFERLPQVADAGPTIERLILGARFQNSGAAEVVERVAADWLTTVGLDRAKERSERALQLARSSMPEDGDAARLEAGLTKAQEALSQAEERLAEQQSEQGPLAEARQNVLAIERDGASAVVALWQAGGNAAGQDGVGVDVDLEASRASHQAQEAQERADAARQRGTDARSQNILDGLAASQARRKAGWDRVTEFRTTNNAATSDRADALAKAAKVYQDYQSRSLLLADRGRSGPGVSGGSACCYGGASFRYCNHSIAPY